MAEVGPRGAWFLTGPHWLTGIGPRTGEGILLLFWIRTPGGGGTGAL